MLAFILKFTLKYVLGNVYKIMFIKQLGRKDFFNGVTLCYYVNKKILSLFFNSITIQTKNLLSKSNYSDYLLNFSFHHSLDEVR